jgi:hypothetical protein
LQAIYLGGCVVLGPPGPPSVHILEAMLKHAHLDAIFVAPSTLEDAVKTPQILEHISKLGWIGYGGGPLSKTAGNILSQTNEIVNVLGTTEAGWQLSLRPDREDWDYIVPHPAAGFEFRPHSHGLYQQYTVRGGIGEEFRGIFHIFPDVEGIADVILAH